MRQKIDDIKKEIDSQNEEFYGDETVSGSNPNPAKIQDDTTAEMVGDVIGNDPVIGKSFNIGDEMNKDQNNR